MKKKIKLGTIIILLPLSLSYGRVIEPQYQPSQETWTEFQQKHCRWKGNPSNCKNPSEDAEGKPPAAPTWQIVADIFLSIAGAGPLSEAKTPIVSPLSARPPIRTPFLPAKSVAALSRANFTTTPPGSTENIALLRGITTTQRTEKSQKINNEIGYPLSPTKPSSLPKELQGIATSSYESTVENARLEPRSHDNRPSPSITETDLDATLRSDEPFTTRERSLAKASSGTVAQKLHHTAPSSSKTELDIISYHDEPVTARKMSKTIEGTNAVRKQKLTKRIGTPIEDTEINLIKEEIKQIYGQDILDKIPLEINEETKNYNRSAWEKISFESWFAIRNYKEEGYVRINSVLRSGAAITGDDLIETEQLTNALRAISSARDITNEPTDKILYRGEIRNLVEIHASFEAGETFINKSFLSTSFDKDVISNFTSNQLETGDVNVEYQIERGSALSGINISDILEDSEAEVVFAPDTHFTVTNIEETDDTVIIQMRTN